MITVPQLRDMLPQSFAAEAARWGATAQWAEEAWRFVEGRMLAADPPPDDEAATAARDRLRLLSDNCRYARARCGLVETALTGLAEELTEARTSLRAALDEAAELGYEVTDDGGLRHPAPAAAVASSGIGHRATATGLAQRIAAALRRAEETDARYAPALAELTAAPGFPGAPAVPDGHPPRANRAWWDGLSPQERDALLTVRPARIGALDGLPATVRDRANRSVLELIDAESADSARWPAGIAVLRARLDRRGAGGPPPAFLLAFSTDGPGRAVIANGDPDTAARTAVVVPAPGAGLDTVAEELSHATDLWRHVQQLTPGERVSTVTWLGDPLAPAALRDFTAGLRAARRASGPGRITLIGQGHATGSLARQAWQVVGAPGEVPDESEETDANDDVPAGVARPAPAVKSVPAARAEARSLSSEILDVIAVRGTVSEPGPGVSLDRPRSPGGTDPERHRTYRMRHPWSLSGVPREALEAGLDRLRRELPERGWEIVEDGEQPNAHRSPRLLLAHPGTGYTVDATLAGGPGEEPLLTLSFVSAAFRTPEGESPRGQF
ncbi:hypothetical protein [Streptomyces sp. NBC_01803]|uniref:hypothetical protein n=1 Tax=Streptomyces sp. NBC_01803 TaxID=2975946 RepID=UPI002DDADD77|nr:hypothetical protein [Streptomyces sp. NBC_01803]WSA44895.1 alpha/beta hydrolase family protein [Streptomyces sp. NBC_01803]